MAKVDLQAEKGVEVIRLPAYPAGLMVSPYVSQLAEMFAQGIREGLADIGWEPESNSSDSQQSPEVLPFHVA